MSQINIGDREIGDGNSTYVILEIARTYDNFDEAKEMISIAADAGADAIKIQSILANELMVKNSHTYDYVEMLEGLERTEEQHQFLKEVCIENKIDFLSTPEGPTMIKLLERINVPAYKVSSLDFVYYELLENMALTRKPIILSTGMAEYEEICETVDFLEKLNANFALLHCSSTYPTKVRNANLRNISFLKSEFGKVVGYSDHTVGIQAPILAVSLGASIIEKHFTLDRRQDGADHYVGVDEKMLREMMHGIRTTEEMLGSYERKLCDEELEMKNFKRRKMVASTNLNKGDEVTRKNVNFLQTKSNQGIDGRYVKNIMGKKIVQNIERGHIFSWENFYE